MKISTLTCVCRHCNILHWRSSAVWRLCGSKVCPHAHSTHTHTLFSPLTFPLDRSSLTLCISATDLEGPLTTDASKAAWATLRSCDGVLVPGGFGERGIEGMIRAAQYAREEDVPFLGVCLGLQIAVIEFARNVLGLQLRVISRNF